MARAAGQTNAADPPAGRAPVLDPALRRTATVTVLGSIMSILDTTIVAVALDTLGRDFKVSISTIQWVTTGYLLALAMVIPVTGWAVDRVGAKRMWMLSLTLFISGSILCGLAWSAPTLILFRVLQGLGGGMILPIGQSIVARAAGPQRMGRVMSVIGVPTVLGPVLGPVIGGLIVSNVSWRWIFFVNVPIGIVALFLAWRWLEPDRQRVDHRFDLVGFLLLSPGLTLLVYALSEVGTTGSFSSPEVLVSFSIGMVLLAAFGWHSFKSKLPAAETLLDLRLFRYRSYTIANVSIFLLGAMLFGSMFLLPLYYQVVRGQSALAAGLLMAPQGLGAALVMRRAGIVTDRVGARRVVPLGVVLIVAGSLPYVFVTTSTSELLLGGALLLRGIGLGLAMMPMVAAGYTELDHAAVPRASTTINISRQVGGSIATALLAVVLQRRIESSVPGATSGLSLAAASHVPASVASELASAFAGTFWWVLAIAALLLLPTLFLPHHEPVTDVETRGAPPGGGPPAGPGADQHGGEQPGTPAPAMLTE